MTSTNPVDVIQSTNYYIQNLLSMYGSMGKVVYDRVDRFRDDHELCMGLETNCTEAANVYSVICPWHDAVVVFGE